MCKDSNPLDACDQANGPLAASTTAGPFQPYLRFSSNYTRRGSLATSILADTLQPVSLARI